MATVYSQSFYADTVGSSSSATVGLSTLPGVIVIRSVLVATTDTGSDLQFNIEDSLGNLFLFGEFPQGPAALEQGMRQVWPAGRDMVLSTGLAPCTFWVSGYLLSS
jgi:hypothetical protein